MPSLRLVCISDIHKKHRLIKDIPGGDVLLFAGDLDARSAADVIEFDNWLATLPHRYKLCIAGNHDFFFESNLEDAKGCLQHATYLQDSSIEVEGLLIYGSPWQPWFFDWAFNLPRGAPLKKKWAQIPDNTDILITHGPPYGILDLTSSGKHVGCEDLLQRVLEVQPRLHLFGHIHEANGLERRGKTIFCNASICDLSYDLANRPIVIDIDL